VTQTDLTSNEETTAFEDLPVLRMEDPAFWQDIHSPIQDALAVARMPTRCFA
jgi:hypothetical protein